MDQISTKSIDVGGVFLMDLSVNESDTSNHHQSSDVFGVKFGSDLTPVETNHSTNRNAGLTAAAANQTSTSIAENYRSKHLQGSSDNVYRQPEYLGSSLDRLASVLNCDEQQQAEQATLSMSNNNPDGDKTVALIGHKTQKNGLNLRPFPYGGTRPTCSSSPFSDESFAASSDASLSESFSCSEEEDGCDKGSTATREDSGVLDMKDLEGQLNSCNSFEDRNCTSSVNQYSSDHYHSVEKSATSTSTRVAKNLASFDKAKFDGYQDSSSDSVNKNPKHPHRCGKPTDTSGNVDQCRAYQTHHHQQQNHSNSAGKRRVSASVPIQVPARQMRKDLNKMKLNLLKEEQVAEQDLILGFQEGAGHEMIVNNNKHQNLAAFEDDDAFLEQEYNANHHNHYPINEHGHENLTAEDDPMKLFASIQALARSLHEDAEIFGSLPPKRTLESPIRSMALV